MGLGESADIWKMQIFIKDHGDTSVGIESSNYSIDVPFDKEGTDKEELEYFRDAMIKQYSTYAMGRVTAIYDFEIEAIEKGIMDWENQNNG